MWWCGDFVFGGEVGCFPTRHYAILSCTFGGNFSRKERKEGRTEGRKDGRKEGRKERRR